MPDDVRTPTVAECCGAAAGFAKGLFFPRRRDDRFLRSLGDAGLPPATTTVTITPLRQVARPVPTAAIVEGRFRPWRLPNALRSFVVTHPEATFLVDPSLCVDAGRRALAELPVAIRRAMQPQASAVSTVAALGELDPAPALDFALPTHAHWDHVCGLLDLPDLPVHLHARERDWVMTGAVAPTGGVRDSLRGRPTVTYDLDGPPVLTFTASHDLFGDGAVVLVDLPGHTPGSVGVLLRTEQGWVLLAGDAAWHHRQVEEVRQKAAFPGAFADDDRDETFRTLHRLHAARNHVRIVPTHDPEA